ncbi:MAG: LysE family translocator [Alphaproteobacteria bacterium]|nr:LysE family translocator [Alphaproteobacteria bacterium]HPF47745.1 LysE family translocator [Emcibacteraceae bacterium]
MITTEFLITSLIIVLIPGTGVIYTVSNGLFIGRQASIYAALGCTAGIIPHLLATILGLAALLHVSAVAFQLVKGIGVLYLFFLAWSMWRETGSLKLEKQSTDKKMNDIIIRGFLINILNPKLSIFFLAFLPQFVPSSTDTPVLNLFMLSIIFMIMTFIIFSLYGLFAGSFRTHIIQSPRLMKNSQRTFAAIFAALGIKLALTEQ